jgi:cellulose synthase/poly-beta-1,6-N-acetylglucosamine synthase-like glycosyltransferase
MIARYEDGAFTLDPPRTPLHAFIAMLRGLTIERAIQYEPRARVFTTSPTTIRSLMKQRKRWNTARIEVTGRLWRALGYHWTLGFTAACVMLFMARSVLFGALAYLAIPVALVHEYLLTGFILAYLTHVFISGLLTVLALLVGNELKYWRLLLAVPLTPVYGFWFKWLPGAWGWVSDVLLFGNRTGFAPEATLIKGGSVRIALLFRIRRFFLLLVRALTHGDVPLGSFWLGWGETPWTPSGYEGFTSNKKRRSILPPFKRSSRRG